MVVFNALVQVTICLTFVANIDLGQGIFLPQKGVITRDAFQAFTQSLWHADVNRISNSMYTLDYQGLSTSHGHNDDAPNRLIQFNAIHGKELAALLSSPESTYHAFYNLLDNYEVNVKLQEHRTHQEMQEEQEFLKMISETKVIKTAKTFLVENNIIDGTTDFIKMLTFMWFDLHTKSDPAAPCNVPESRHCYCGFEKTMVGTIDPHHDPNKHTVSGFHNWINFYLQENISSINYKGYVAHLQNPNVADVYFTWQGALAKARSFFVGTSPEFDIALYTVCTYLYTDVNLCPVRINGHDIPVYTSSHLKTEGLQLSSASPRIGPVH